MTFKKFKKTTPVIFILIFSFYLINAQSDTDSLEVNQRVERIMEEAKYLINMPEPQFKPYEVEPPDGDGLADIGFEQVYQNATLTYEMRDGKKLFAYKYPAKSDTTIILMHGALSTAYLYNKTAGLLQEATGAEIIALDGRGHGRSEGAKGDLDYIDQYTDDLADVISYLQKEKPNPVIILAGHSMGGGIALRYAMRKDVPQVNRYLLFAPLLGKNAPTIETSFSEEEEPFIKVHIPRIIGLKMLNILNNHEYDSLPVLYFNLPPEIPFSKYSYSANESMAPDDYRQGLQSVDKPLLVVVGSEDEAFISSEFEPAVSQYSGGKVVVIDGLNHNSLRHSKVTMNVIKEWLDTDIRIKVRR